MMVTLYNLLCKSTFMCIYTPSDAVRITQSLINELNSDLNTTKATQERVEMALSQLRDHIANTTQELEQVVLSVRACTNHCDTLYSGTPLYPEMRTP